MLMIFINFPSNKEGKKDLSFLYCNQTSHKIILPYREMDWSAHTTSKVESTMTAFLFIIGV